MPTRERFEPRLAGWIGPVSREFAGIFAAIRGLPEWRAVRQPDCDKIVIYGKYRLAGDSGGARAGLADLIWRAAPVAGSWAGPGCGCVVGLP